MNEMKNFSTRLSLAQVRDPKKLTQNRVAQNSRLEDLFLSVTASEGPDECLTD